MKFLHSKKLRASDYNVTTQALAHIFATYQMVMTKQT